MLGPAQPTYIQSIAYLSEQCSGPMSELELQTLLTRVSRLTRTHKPTLRQLLHGIGALRLSLNHEQTPDSCFLQVSFLVSVCSLAYMKPSDAFEAESLLNAVIRMLKNEMGSNDHVDQGDPWILGLCCQFLVRFAKILDTQSNHWKDQMTLIAKNILIVFRGVDQKDERMDTYVVLRFHKDRQTACKLLCIMAMKDLSIYCDSISLDAPSDTLSTLHNQLVQGTLESIFDILSRQLDRNNEAPEYPGLIATEVLQDLMCGCGNLNDAHRIWSRLTHPQKQSWVQECGKLILDLSQRPTVDIWVMISKLLFVLATSDGFETLLGLPDTCMNLLQLIVDKLLDRSAGKERHAFLPWMYRFVLQTCLLNVSLYSQLEHFLEPLLRPTDEKSDMVGRLESFFMDDFSDRYEQWYGVMSSVLFTCMEHYLDTILM